MKFTKYLYSSSIIIFVILAISSIITYLLTIITLSECIFYLIFSISGGVALFILKDEDPIGHMLKGEKFKIGQNKILPVAIMALIIGTAVLFDGLLISKGETHSKVIAIIFGASCVAMGFFGIIHRLKNRDNGVRSPGDKTTMGSGPKGTGLK